MKAGISIGVSLVVACFLLPTGVQAGNMVLELEGDPESYFEVPDSESLDTDIEIELTVEAWVNPAVVVPEQLIINKEDVYEIGINNGLVQTAVKPAGQGWVWYDSGLEAPVDEWTHVAVTWDGELVSLFVNGQFAQSYDLVGDDVNDSGDTLKVGRRTRGGETHSIFTGLIDEVRISNVIRYTDDGFTVPTTAFTPDDFTMALYHFDSETNGVVSDASKFGNHGTLLMDARLVPNDFLSSGQPGDFNGDGVLGAADIDDLTAKSASMANPAEYDLNGDARVDDKDVAYWAKELFHSWVGDANLDKQFNSSDLVTVLASGSYEVDIASNWSSGDFDGNGRTNSGDLVAALADGGYELGPPAAVASVPEPSAITSVVIGAMLAIAAVRSRADPAAK